MSALDLARLQFGVTTVYHFFFVPLTIGMALLVAILQTAEYRTGKPGYDRLARFFGKLFLINFAMGVVTGIVQEFQFGMNWSAYSRFVGDIFGAPLAIEGLLAFFMESTFLGLWIFGRDRLPKRVHLLSIWMVSIGTWLSAYFILAANSWMQHPVGFTYNRASGRAELTDFWAVLTNKVLLVTFPHTIIASIMVGGAFIAAVACWHVFRDPDGPDSSVFRTAARLGAVTVLVAGVGVAITGDAQGKVMTEVQPMKMAAAEALYRTEQPASFSLFTIGSLDGSREVYSLRVPDLLSFLATGSFHGQVKGIDALQRQYVQRYGAGHYAPVIPVTYWSFRLMIGVGVLSMLVAGWMLFVLRRGRAPGRSRWVAWVTILSPLLPLVGCSFGWIFTEMGRQPWLVFGLMRTNAGVSPGTTTAMVLTSLISFTVLYGVLAVIETRLLLAAIRTGLPDPTPPDDGSGDESESRPLSFAY